MSFFSVRIKCKLTGEMPWMSAVAWFCLQTVNVFGYRSAFAIDMLFW